MFGEYPCCGAALAIALPEKTPAYMPESCPSCGAKVWHRFSRIEPQSWTEADFLAEFEVDDAAKTIKERNPKSPAPPIPPVIVEAFVKMVADSILYGDPATRESAGSGPPTGLLSSHGDGRRRRRSR
jgi:hypothetical protein